MLTLQKMEVIAVGAQREQISRVLLSNIGGTMRRIEKWDDFRYHLSWFSIPQSHVGSMSYSNVRRWMRRLEEAGIVELDPHRRPYGPLRWRYPREMCNRLAVDAIQHWKDMGYSQDENRPIQPPKGRD